MEVGEENRGLALEQKIARMSRRAIGSRLIRQMMARKVEEERDRQEFRLNIQKDMDELNDNVDEDKQSLQWIKDKVVGGKERSVKSRELMDAISEMNGKILDLERRLEDYEREHARKMGSIDRQLSIYRAHYEIEVGEERNQDSE